MKLRDLRPAALTIDLHRGHLDPEVATMALAPDKAARVVEANTRFLRRCRDAGIPIVHVITSYRDVTEISSNPFWKSRANDPNATRKNVERHNIAGSPGCDLMPGVCEPDRDWVVDTKKRYDCFFATDLDFVLRAHGINTVLITGINTNSCVLATTVAANARDYAAIVIEDCIDTMDGDELHDAGLRCIRTAFGWVMSGEDAIRTCVKGHVEGG